MLSQGLKETIAEDYQAVCKECGHKIRLSSGQSHYRGDCPKCGGKMEVGSVEGISSFAGIRTGFNLCMSCGHEISSIAGLSEGRLCPRCGDTMIKFDGNPDLGSVRIKSAEAFITWFERYLEEAQPPYAQWDIEDQSGTTHIIDSDVVIEAIKNAPSHEQAGIKDTIVRIDFAAGDVNDFFKHLADALVQQSRL